MNDDLAPLLSTLPEPAAPASITATVMARIERDAAARHDAAAEDRRHPRESSTWVTACVGILFGVGATAVSWYANGVPDLFAMRMVSGGLDAALVGWPATAAGLAGVALCLRALLAPLRSHRR